MKFLLPSLYLLCSSQLALAAVPMQADREPEAATGYYQQQLVHAEQFMVSAAHPLASQAGIRVLEQGGSAMDAAIAVQLVLGLVEAQSSGIGGGAFILHWDQAQQQMITIDGRETAPKAVNEQLFMQGDSAMPWREAYVGGKSVGVPGLFAAMYQAHQRYGKLAWTQLFDDAIRLASEGFPVSDRMARQLEVGWNQGISHSPEASSYFYPDGKPLQAGAVITNQAYADILRQVAEQGPVAFYQGNNAAAMVKTVQQAKVNAGTLALTDLAAYQAVEREPVCGSYRSYTICGMPPPSSGGIAVVQILGLLERFELGQLAPDSVEAIHLFGLASQLAFADRDHYVADSDFVEVPTQQLIDPAYLATRSALIQTDKALVEVSPGQPTEELVRLSSPSPELSNTTHFSIVDADGNAVSMTSSIENVFGSGLMVNGYLLNNQLTDFSLSPELNGDLVANRVQGGKRPRSSMSPVMVFDGDGKLRIVLGSPGGSRIINYVAQTLVALIDWQLDIQAAINLPRVTHRNDFLALEKGTAIAQHQSVLEKMGHQVRLIDLNSGLHGIVLLDTGLQGGADPRREGQVLGH
ncbi:gamma-glutamyltransferase [Alkalimonas amylolytica]|uniref:Glutathione hydrolase proenzyme n=1 Tax=Alkalimonas amylolytica TaxID=152573 RepID=A0A1H4A5V4_ALKAM|nr:gamma-glutamyltransferase [Alkalimonas amylolytica]SEA31355.1 gamma-glutamyltranspeptidase / glutathione hydrolase [Alkalimonas amylolytica]